MNGLVCSQTRCRSSVAYFAPRGRFKIVDQLNDAAGSISANLAEAKDGESKKDFIHKNSVSLKEANESNYWLKRAWRADESLRKQAEPLIQESRELISILTAIIVEAKSNPNRGDNAG